MDRRKLHKVNGQTIGKNKQISSRTRANNRAAHQDANREIEPEEVPVRVSRLERMKLWRLERAEKKKEEEQKKRKPFVTVVKRGVFLDKTNYTELNKQRRKKVGTKKVNAAPNISVQVQSETAISDHSISNGGRVALTETQGGRIDNQHENAGMLAVPDDSALNGTFEMQTSDAADIVENSSLAVHNADQHSMAAPVAGVNLLTVPNVTSELNNTFEMENSVESNGTGTAVGDADMLTVPENTSVLNTTFEMQNSVETNGNSEPGSQSSVGEPSTLSAHAGPSIKFTPKQTNIPGGNRPSIKSTPRAIKTEGTPAGRRPSIRFAASSVKSENIPEVSRPSIKSTPKAIKTESIPVGQGSSVETTPKSVLSTSLTYVSPFVTIGRGKGSAHKEVKVRESFYKLELSQSEHDSPVNRQNSAAAQYFRSQVDNETTNLMEKVEYWTKYKADNDHIDSVYLDQIDVAIGQTRLLISKKFKQFLGLCDDCEKGTSEQKVLSKDLEGFWSMVYMQVENCGVRFQKLMTLRENNWVEVDLLPAKVTKQTRNKKAARKGVVATSGIQKMIEEARLKMKESKITATATSSSTTAVGNGFAMTLRQTPARLSISSGKTPRSIIKVKTPGVKRSTKSVAFSFIESPATSQLPKVAGTPMPKVIRRRASTSGVPTERKCMTTDGVSAFMTPDNRKVSAFTATSTDRRSSRRLFSNVEK